MTGVGDDSRGRLLGRPWLVVGFVLAVGATLALVLSDDLRYLRLGIVAALWAALIGAFLAVKYRKQAVQSEDEVAEAQAVYELELEREIAARREYELEMEAENRTASDSRGREELAALRAEVTALRDSLQSLFGGEVLLERVALTAQATRMRKVGDDNRLVTSGENGKKKPAQLLAGKKPVVDVGGQRERPTELIDRVLDERRRTASNGKPANGVNPANPNGRGLGKNKLNGKPANDKPAAGVSAQSTQQIARPKPLSERRPPVPAVDPALNAAQRALKDAELRAEAARRQAESQPMRLPGLKEAANQEPSPAEATRRDVRPEPRPEARPEPRPEPRTEIRRPEPPPARRAEASRSEMRPAEVSRSDIRPVERSRTDMRAVEMSRPDMRPVERSRTDMRPVERSRTDMRAVEMSRPDMRPVERSRTDIRPVERSRTDMRAVEMSRPDLPRVGQGPPPSPNGARPDAARKSLEQPLPSLPRPDLTRPAMGGPERGRPASSVPLPNSAQSAQPGNGNSGEWKTGRETRSPDRPVSDLSAAFPSRDDFAERQRPNRPMPPEPAPGRPAERKPVPPMPRDATPSRTDLPPVAPPTAPVQPSPALRQPSRTNLPPVVPPTTPVPAAMDGRQPSRLEQFSRPDMSPILDEPPVSRHGAHRAPMDAAAKAPAPEAQAPVNPTLPESVRNFQGSGGRRRKPTDSQVMPAVSPPMPAPEPSGGGRRRRPEGEPPAWEGMVAERASLSRRNMVPVDPADVDYSGNGNGNGYGSNGNGNGNGRPNGEPAQPPRNGHRSADQPAPGSGSHTAGRSVSELLAANGGTGSTPRRRRRAED